MLIVIELPEIILKISHRVNFLVGSFNLANLNGFGHRFILPLH